MARLVSCPKFAKSRHFDGSGKGVVVGLSILSSPAPDDTPVSLEKPPASLHR